MDFALAGWTNIALSGPYSLTVSNGDDEARSALLKFTGSGSFAVTVPSVSKRYDVFNAASGALTMTTGAGASAVLVAGEVASVICDGANIYKIKATDLGAARLTSLADPVGAQDAATKAYVDAQVFASFAGALPGQAGNAGNYLKTNGSAPAWTGITTADLADYLPDQTARATALKAFAVAAAVAL